MHKRFGKTLVVPFFHYLAGPRWLAAGRAVGLAGQPASQPGDQSAGRLQAGWPGQLAGWLASCLAAWLTDQLAGWLAGPL